MDIHSELPDNPNWERPVRAYASSMGIIFSQPPSGGKTCVGLTSKITVKIKTPANESTVSGVFTISVGVDSAVGIKSVEFLIDDKNIGIDTTTPYSMTYNADDLSPGAHRISVVVTDTTGLSSSDSVIVKSVTKLSPTPVPAASATATT
mgnify:FL=1